jgi:citrate lyase beta subunit
MTVISSGLPVPPTALTDADLAAVDGLLAPADAERIAKYPGDLVTRQPVHTVYVPADRMHPGLAAEWGRAASAALAADAPTAAALAAATGLDPDDVAGVWPALTRKLETEPIEDLRVDLEDGYGDRPDDEEDAHALAAGAAIATATSRGSLPPYVGVRFKSLEGGTRRRGLRSLDLVLGAVLAAADLPDGWLLTLPKVTSPAQVAAMADVCGRLERGHGLRDHRLRFEIQVETPQAILGPDGVASIAPMVHAADGRCAGLHFGTYDYTAALGIAGGFQSMDHPASDHAKTTMQLAAAGTGVRVCDGSTNVLPVGSTANVHAGWALHARLVRRSLERGYYQGWDLHPAQLPTRYLSTYLFFRDDLATLGGRLHTYLHGGDDAGVLDEPATAQALAGFILRGVHCGAVDDDELKGLVGTDLATLVALADRRVG